MRAPASVVACLSAVAVLTVGCSTASDSAGDDAATTAQSAAPSPAVDVEPEAVDTDGDGVEDASDFRVNDPSIQTADDIDSDGDGVSDPDDDFPQDATFSSDADGDGVADRLDAFPSNARYVRDSDGDGVADAVDAYPTDPSRSEITTAMENALGSAQDYLEYSAFSRQGLIDQLSSDYGSGYMVDDATWAVGQLSVDWKEQAVRSGREYLDFSNFSRQGLIDQLSSSYGSKFTIDEAVYAVDQIGL